MFQQLKNVLYQRFPAISSKYHAHRRLISNNNSYLHQTGWIQNILKDGPTIPINEAIPWMNYSFLAFIEERLNDQMKMFEFGSGQSTFYFSQRVHQIVSVEYNQSWFDFVKRNAADNIQLIYREQDIDGEYCRTINGTPNYDIVVVDGRDRVNCCTHAEQNLSDSGVIILDDSQRDRYKPAFTYLRSLGFKYITITGLKPSGTAIDATTIFYRSDNCLGI